MDKRSVAEQVSRVLPELYALTPIEQYPARALSVVRRMVAGDKGDYTEVDLLSGDFRVLVDPEPPLLRELGSARVAYTNQHPVLAHFLSRETPSARLISDFLTRHEFHRLELYGEFFARLGVEDQITVAVATRSSGRGAGISIDRDRRSFDDHDRRLLDSLQPHLAAARDNAIRFSRALSQQRQSDEPPLAPTLERLTDRQREVLAQLSCGHTNAQVALSLDISVGTVRKHVEHILRGLGVSTRTAAAVLYIEETSTRAAPWTASIPAMLNDRDGPVPRDGERGDAAPIRTLLVA